MPPKKGKSEAGKNGLTTLDDQLDADLSSIGLRNVVRFADEMSDDVECVSTGFPSLDNILHPKNKGIPRGRLIELYSRNPSSGKSTLSAQIISSFQKQGYRTALIEPERTHTKGYLSRLGVLTTPGGDPDKYALRWVKEEDPADPWPAEQYMETAIKMADIMDLIVIDSVASMIPKGELERELDDNPAMGELARLLGRALRKMLGKRACLLFVNQSRTAGSSSYGPIYTTPGGKALDFYSSIRIELSMVQKLSINAESAPYGMIVSALTTKNKSGGSPYQKANLTYINGDGFTEVFDYLELGIKAGVVEKSGAWYSAFGERIGQGKINAYEMLKDNKDIFMAIKKAVDGEPAEEPAA
jgi:recombination protein RecA